MLVFVLFVSVLLVLTIVNPASWRQVYGCDALVHARPQATPTLFCCLVWTIDVLFFFSTSTLLFEQAVSL